MYTQTEDGLSVKKGREKGEKGRKSKKTEDKTMDNTQSEVSYALPDTDLIRFKASRKAFSEPHLPLHSSPHSIHSSHITTTSHILTSHHHYHPSHLITIPPLILHNHYYPSHPHITQSLPSITTSHPSHLHITSSLPPSHPHITPSSLPSSSRSFSGAGSVPVPLYQVCGAVGTDPGH